MRPEKLYLFWGQYRIFYDTSYTIIISKTGFSGLKLDQSFANLLAAASCLEMQCESSIYNYIDFYVK